MAGSHAPDLEFAVQLAGRAGDLLTASYERVARVDRKSKRDVVTDVDYASEALVIKAIRERFPGDAILAEESGRHERADSDGKPAARPHRARWSRRTWVVDPLDGTVNYANGIPFFCVSIGLIEDGAPAVGVVLDPLRGDCYAATADGAATLNGDAVRAGDKEQLGDFVVSLAIIGRSGIARERRVAGEIRIGRRMGSAALALAYVASGRFDAFVQNGGLSLWDIAAAGLIAERAGATVSDLHGGPWWNTTKRGPRLSIVAAPQPHQATLLELLRAARTTVETRR
ncbi:MAG: inositol monophosphatase [Chloroflexota bacterium]|nr:inositol monophosphatase [Chloroflexota bacterium]